MNDHYFTKKPQSILKVKKIDVSIQNKELKFLTPSGVFSFGRIDPASHLLVQHAKIEHNTSVFDIGCGWGFVGITLKKINPSINVIMSDVNQRAVEFAKKNAIKNDVPVTIREGEYYATLKAPVDVVLVNPPMKAGRKICYAMIEQAPMHLNKKGMLYLVALHNKGGKMLEKKMLETFGNVTQVIKKSGIRVYLSTKE